MQVVREHEFKISKFKKRNINLYNARMEYLQQYKELSWKYKDLLQVELWTTNYYGTYNPHDISDFYKNQKFSSSADIMKNNWLSYVLYDGIIHYEHQGEQKKSMMEWVEYTKKPDGFDGILDVDLISNIPGHYSLQTVKLYSSKTITHHFTFKKWYNRIAAFDNGCIKVPQEEADVDKCKEKPDTLLMVWGKSKNDVTNYIQSLLSFSMKFKEKMENIDEIYEFLI